MFFSMFSIYRSVYLFSVVISLVCVGCICSLFIRLTVCAEMVENSLSRGSVRCAECDEKLSSQHNLKIHFHRNHPGKLAPKAFHLLHKRGYPPSLESGLWRSKRRTWSGNLMEVLYLLVRDDGQNMQSPGTNNQVSEQILNHLNTMQMKNKKQPSYQRAVGDSTKLEYKHENDEIENRIEICFSLKDITT